jgi:NADPH:quinone reductase-like Zn-dependent oxidoreductase
MKAAVFTKTSSGKMLDIHDLPLPVPKPKQVLIEVRAASVNPLDWRLKLRRPGVDLSGIVKSVGESVTRFKPGDAVFGTGRGAFAEYACAPENKLISKPESISFSGAASVPIAGLTALQALRDKGHLRPGQKVLINGAAGGVGTFAVQLAKSMGADVTGVCRTQNVEMVRSLGANRAVDYSREDFAEDGSCYDLILDNAARRPLSALRRVMAPAATCVLVGAPKSIWPTITGLAELLVRRVVLRQRITTFIAKVTAEDLTAILNLILSGKITPMIDKVYPLHEAADAIAYVETGHARAKVIISMNTP